MSDISMDPALAALATERYWRNWQNARARVQDAEAQSRLMEKELERATELLECVRERGLGWRYNSSVDAGELSLAIEAFLLDVRPDLPPRVRDTPRELVHAVISALVGVIFVLVTISWVWAGTTTGRVMHWVLVAAFVGSLALFVYAEDR